MVKVSLGGNDSLKSEYELIIIGGGPAGLTASMYAARARIDHILMEKNPIPGGQIVNTESVENYPGFEEPLSGFELMEKFRTQARNFGAKIVNATVSALTKSTDFFNIKTDIGETKAKTVIIASGASPRRMGIEGEEKFIGRGISFCATCDAALYKDKKVAVIGGGDAGLEESMFLSKFASSVIVFEMMDHLNATRIIQERARKISKIEVKLSSAPVEVIGDDVVRGLIVKNLKDDTTEQIDVDGIFVFIGIIPNTDFIEIDEVERDRGGFVITDDNMMTKVPGLFAAGDVRSKLLRQVSTSVGDGAMAEFAAQKFLENF
ncbi:thioredoxin-disulfide reductase [bacterium]|nr:thioredoxin-disulfide reductase [bacterium]